MSNLIYCVVKIKQEQIPWNLYQNNPALRKQKTEEAQKQFVSSFYDFINQIVTRGGTICLDKYALDSEWRMLQSQVRVKLKQDDLDQIRKLPYIEDVSIDIRRT